MQKAEQEYLDFITELKICHHALQNNNHDHPSVFSLDWCIDQFKPFWVIQNNQTIEILKGNILKILKKITDSPKSVLDFLFSRNLAGFISEEDMKTIFPAKIIFSPSESWQLIVCLQNQKIVNWEFKGSYKTVTLTLTFSDKGWKPTVEGLVTETKKIEYTLKECKLMAKIQSPYVMHTLPGPVLDIKGSQSFHSPWIAEGDMYRFRKSSLAKDGVDMLNIFLIFYTAFLGLQALYSVGIIHQDIKYNNILIGRDVHGRLYIIITDFSLAVLAADSKNSQACTTPGWESPEYLQHLLLTQNTKEHKRLSEYNAYIAIKHFKNLNIPINPYSEPHMANDIWAMAVILHQFLSIAIHVTESHNKIYQALRKLTLDIFCSTRESRKDANFYLARLILIMKDLSKDEIELFYESLDSHIFTYCTEKKLNKNQYFTFFSSPKSADDESKKKYSPVNTNPELDPPVQIHLPPRSAHPAPAQSAPIRATAAQLAVYAQAAQPNPAALAPNETCCGCILM